MQQLSEGQAQVSRVQMTHLGVIFPLAQSFIYTL